MNINPNYEELQNIQNNKINFFCAQIGCNDISRAERYLTAANWDENHAVQIFLNNHPNHRLQQQNNGHNLFPQNQHQFQPQLPPPSQINNINRPQLSNIKIKENYLEFGIGQILINNRNLNQPNSKCLEYISSNLKNVEKNFGSFLKQLKNKPGIILVINEKAFNQIQIQIKQFRDKSDVLNNCVIYPVLDNFSIGNEFVQQLSIISNPCYIFCKYKDDKNFYITDRMEGAFDINFFINKIRKNQPKQNDNINNNLNSKTDLNLNKKNNNNRNNSNRNNINNNNIKNDNNNKKEFNQDNSNNLINNLKKNNYFDQKDIRKINQQKKQNNNNIRNNKNQNIPNKKEPNRNNQSSQNNEPKINNPNIIPNNQQNNNYHRFEPENYGDFFLGNSIEMLNLFKQNNNNNNIDVEVNNNNMDVEVSNNDLIEKNKNDNNFIEPNINNNNNSSNNNNRNILADSIYQLSDGQILEKRENEMRALEKEQEEKEKKELEEKRKELEEENRIKMIKKNYEYEAEIAKMIVPEEPDENNIDVCKIVFRVPDGEKNIERRFLKTDKVSVLFNYVKSKGREILTEPDSKDFDLYVGFPPKNLKDRMNNTLEEEQLYPNSLIQIREV